MTRRTGKAGWIVIPVVEWGQVEIVTFGEFERVPVEHGPGQRQQRQSITKTGNPRLRWALCEAAWRLVRFQPDYRLCKKWRAQILNPKLGAGRRKQLIVALARGFGVDWWRLCTGQTTAEKLGLVLVD